MRPSGFAIRVRCSVADHVNVRQATPPRSKRGVPPPNLSGKGDPKKQAVGERRSGSYLSGMSVMPSFLAVRSR